MSWRKQRTPALLAALLILAPCLGSCWGLASTAPQHAVWLYGFDDATFDNSATLELLQRMSISRVHLSLGGVASHRAIDPNSGGFDGAYTARLDDFITRAAADGIVVHAMSLEDPGFTRPSSHAFGQGLVENILAYNTNHPAASFAGLHINVEPYTPAVWTGHTLPDYAQLDGLVQDFGALLGLLRDDLDEHQANTGQDLEFSATVAWWFNEQAALGNVPSADAVLLAEHVDTLVPLVFDGVGATATAIAERSRDELAEAQTLIGIGAAEIGSWEDRLDVLAALDEEFSSNPSYVGTSTFHYHPLLTRYQAALPEPAGLGMLTLLFGLLLLTNRALGRPSAEPPCCHDDRFGTPAEAIPAPADSGRQTIRGDA